MRKPSEGVDPRVLREYDTLRLLAKYEVKNVPLPYARLTDLCLEDRWVATESTPIVLTNMLPGRQATASDFYDNRDEILAGFRGPWAQLDRIPEPEIRELLQEPMPEDRDTAGFFRWIIDKQRRLFEDLLQNPAAARIFDQLQIPRDMFDLVEAMVEEAEPEDFTLLHGDVIPDNTLLPFGMVDWDLALLGPRCWDKAILDHRGVAGILSSADMPVNVRIARAILDVQRVAHDTVPAILGREMDPSRDTAYMASYAAVLEMAGTSARGSADLVRRALGHNHQLVVDTASNPRVITVPLREDGQAFDETRIRNVTHAIRGFVRETMSDWPGWKQSAAATATALSVGAALRTSVGRAVLMLVSTNEPWWNRVTRVTVLDTGTEPVDLDIPAGARDWIGEFEDTRLSDNSEGWNRSLTFVMRTRYFGTVSADKTMTATRAPDRLIGSEVAGPLRRAREYSTLGECGSQAVAMTEDEASRLRDLASSTRALRIESPHRWSTVVADSFFLVGDQPAVAPTTMREAQLLALLHRHGVTRVPRPLCVLEPQAPHDGSAPVIVEERLPGHPVAAAERGHVVDEVDAPVQTLLEQLRQVPATALTDGYLVADDPARLLRTLVDEDMRTAAAHGDKLAAHNIPAQPFAPILAMALRPKRSQLIPAALTIDNILFVNGRVSGFTGWRRVMWADPDVAWATLGLSLGTEPGGGNQRVYRDYLRISRLLRALAESKSDELSAELRTSRRASLAPWPAPWRGTAALDHGADGSLEGRVMFPASTPGNPDAAVVRVEDPKDYAGIESLVRQGYIVRTRADANVVEAVNGDTSRRDEAFASGAQLVSTDFPRTGPAVQRHAGPDLGVSGIGSHCGRSGRPAGVCSAPRHQAWTARRRSGGYPCSGAVADHDCSGVAVHVIHRGR
ncbi:Ca2+-dependent phosphoinositide-specific phospholipase C [Nocardia fusca]|uniref:Ca2+-dependent phosphoinositide-specific phospholipase C n=1 Tax=Nocardia fusca TaxID=941183 RepID=UPI0037CAB30F